MSVLAAARLLVNEEFNISRDEEKVGKLLEELERAVARMDARPARSWVGPDENIPKGAVMIGADADDNALVEKLP